MFFVVVVKCEHNLKMTVNWRLFGGTFASKQWSPENTITQDRIAGDSSLFLCWSRCTLKKCGLIFGIEFGNIFVWHNVQNRSCQLLGRSLLRP